MCITFYGRREHFAAVNKRQRQQPQHGEEHVGHQRCDWDCVDRIASSEHALGRHDDEQRGGHAQARRGHERSAFDAVQYREGHASGHAGCDGHAVPLDAKVVEHVCRVREQRVQARQLLAHDEPRHDQRRQPHGALCVHPSAGVGVRVGIASGAGGTDGDGCGGGGIVAVDVGSAILVPNHSSAASASRTRPRVLSHAGDSGIRNNDAHAMTLVASSMPDMVCQWKNTASTH